MAGSGVDREVRLLFQRLLGVLAVAVGLFVLFTVFNERVLHGFTQPEVLLLEAGAVLLLSYFVARALTDASTAVLVRRGQVQHGATVRVFLNILIGVGAVLALFDLAGVSAQSLFLGSAFAGIVLGLAAQTVLANLFAGLLLVVSNPFRPGDRVSLVNSNFGVLPPSYPHEAVIPSYSGTVEDIGLVHTRIGLDAGGTAKVPNATVLSSLIVHAPPGSPRAYRVRMTFSRSVAPATVEAALAALPAPPGGPRSGDGAPRLEVADLSPTTWDGVVRLWSAGTDESEVRDRVMRAVLTRSPLPTPEPSFGDSSRPPP